ncbi:2-succinyl-5-enolpyruvyl-6-hydroxy-3-cyclohexene-1-carboxylic-acid synthase [Peribacillus cavernae]|uniref:2-succinyl-5-enolpyruvyl-6-hydroxy-3-cyclohexene-1-carboxylate synthase n=1 Tax=Peribacillus cavernae TaxID=1674310 RepID=A0A3S0WBM7_9BACI|nr:2-succinyl-5-enolpyruvyl-6-hydroxy-3-cyclohexene-1-carboxylic-acid synthase [Peribacillus cavernae]MDQ0220256.1 2-succinyl-5-enolpyruvyl-6-hydroxy-3-cyclohexene-1-carboxylate synthase [Peribacillus cavernae]RUQ31921.1 2-succinyl-5-enolpyruvyl-6-hydroxy-3-cyclohexene-1-carboxylic-acid synthase [Peribacillus cavernae]
MNDREAITAYIASFVDELARNNIKHVVVSPGSRSTPLALVLAEHPDITIHLNIDERSAAFFALGLAKALHEPVAMVCTSGTATANYYPAIIEAYYSRVPLLVLTADRPHELRDVGAPQAIDQIHLYGKHVKWFVEMAIPEHTEEMIRYARTIGARALATAAKEPAGPVHLNFPLREPLVPLMETVKNYRINEKAQSSAAAVEGGELILASMQLQAMAETLSESKRGIIICGELRNDEMKTAIISLAEKLSFPILADPLSQLRSGSPGGENIIDCYDTFLRGENASRLFNPDLVLRFGAVPVSKALLLYLKKHRNTRHLVVDGGAGWREPAGLVTDMIYSNEIFFCNSIGEHIEQREKSSWLGRWRQVNDATKNALESIRDEEELSEGKLFILLQDLMPNKSHLFVGNSMPIRDLDTFFFSNNKEIRTFANRGANGIDGVVSTALGVSTVLDNTVLVIGDLSFFHDMNGLMAAKLQQTNITILLINNDGGGIFSFLPQASEKDYFETLFGTPHGLDFSHAVALYGGKYTKVCSWDEFKEAFTNSFEIQGLKVIEVPTARETNVLKHRELWSYVSQEIKEALNEEIK